MITYNYFLFLKKNVRKQNIVCRSCVKFSLTSAISKLFCFYNIVDFSTKVLNECYKSKTNSVCNTVYVK